MHEFFSIPRPGRPEQNTFLRFTSAFHGAKWSALIVWPLLAFLIFPDRSDQFWEYAGAAINVHTRAVIWPFIGIVLWLTPATFLAGATAYLVSLSFPDRLTQRSMWHLGFKAPFAILTIILLGKAVSLSIKAMCCKLDHASSEGTSP